MGMRIVVIAVAVLLAAGTASAEKSAATKSLAKCQQAVGKETQKLEATFERALGGCLQLVSDQVVALGGDGPAAAAAPKCAKLFRGLDDSRKLGKSAVEKLRSKVLGACDPAGHAHTLADVLGTGALVPEPLDVADLGLWCADLGGDGAIDDVGEWADCLVAANGCHGAQAVAARYPRALEWLAAVRTAMQALPPADPAAITDAVAVLDRIVAMLDPNHDDVLDTRCGGSTLCPPGSFGIEGKSPCAACPAGFFSAAEGASECAPCDRGSYADTPGSTACIACDAGSYTAQPGSSACSDCPAGTFVATTGATACAGCQPGHFASASGSTACAACGVGKFQDRVGSSACLNCAAGSFADVPGSTTCAPCAPGRFATNAAATTCATCDPGFFQAESGKAGCQPCPAGTFVDDPGATSCFPCAPGKANALTGQTACTECPAGKFGDVPGQPFCSSCPPGRFSTTPGSTACFNCEPGKFNADSEATSCTDCPADTYAPISGLAQCFPCEGAAAGAISCDCSVP